MKLHLYFSQKSRYSLYFLFIILNLFSTFKSFAEGEPGRYFNPIFPVLKETKDITYAKNLDLDSQIVDLKLDLYEPSADTQARRPLIIYLHGGSFQNGDKTDSDAVQLSRYFAKRGYVTASINYRLGVSNLTDPVSFAEAIYRAIQDGRSAVRYFRANAVQYKIDTSRMYIGGASAGSISAIHAAYLGPEIVPTIVDQNKLGGLDAADNLGFSSRVHAVINAFGAIMDTSWITSNSAPIVSIHGENDQTVPYKYMNFGQFSLFGSYYIYQRAINVGIRSKLLSFPNWGHGLSPQDTGKIDTTFRTIRDFLYMVTTGNDSTPTLLSQSNYSYKEVIIYPNPATDYINISNFKSSGLKTLNIIKLDGKTITTHSVSNNWSDSYTIKLPQLPNGIYFLKLEKNKGITETKKLVISR